MNRKLFNFTGGTGGGDVATRKPFHGIETIGALSVASDTTAHTFTIGTGVTYWYKGTKVVVAEPVSILLSEALTDSPDGEITQAEHKLYHIYFNDATGALKAGDAMNLKEKCPVASLYTNTGMTAVALTQEPHNHTRNLDWHINAHLTIGTRYQTGLALVKPSALAHDNLDIGTGILRDEDITITIPPIEDEARLWRQVSGGVYTWTDIALPYAGSVNAPEYLDTDTYLLAAAGNNKYVCYWVYGSNDKDRPIYIIPSQIAAPHNTVTLARAETQPILTGLTSELAPEWKLLYRWIYNGNGDFEEREDFRLVSSLPGGGVTAAQAASAVSVVPVNGITATNVQTALEDLASAEYNPAPADGAYSGETTTEPVGENVAFGDLLYYDWTDKEYKKAAKGAAATMPVVAIALETKGNGDPCKLLRRGFIHKDAWAFDAAIVMAGDSAAPVTTLPVTTGHQVQRIGTAITAKIMYFNPDSTVVEVPA